jgi:hypothetical protein
MCPLNPTIIFRVACGASAIPHCTIPLSNIIRLAFTGVQLTRGVMIKIMNVQVCDATEDQ